MKKKKAYLLNVNYTEKNGQTYVILLVKGKKTTRLYYPYDPYFLVDAPESEIDKLKKVATQKNGKIVAVKDVKIEKRIINFKEKKFLKIVCHSPKDVPILKHVIPYAAYEFDIPFVKRFLFDFQLTPLSIIYYEREGKTITKIIKCEEGSPKLKTLAFDIETYNPLGTPRPKKDPIIMISYANEKKGVLTYKKTEEKNALVLANEKEIVEKFQKIVKEEDPDVIFGYNSGNFDLPYLSERMKILKIDFDLGRGKGKIKSKKKGIVSGAAINNRIHIDLYPIIRLFGFIGVLKTTDYTLDAVANEVLGKSKIEINRENMWKIWDSGSIDELVKYSLKDAELTMELGKLYLPLEMELSIITKQLLFETTLSTSGQLVENLLMFHSAKRKELIPTKPVGGTVEERLSSPIQGGFVKLPQPGIYENIAVLDFRSLYPSIIVSFNIDPSAIVEEKTNCYQSPTGTCFRKSPKALIPAVLEELIDFRAKLKKQLKNLDKKSEDYQKLSARVQAIKILANSFYGYTAYARSRWYCRECGESITAWGRKYIQETMEKAEKAGFEVIYGDTDSIMLIYKNKDDVFRFIEEINQNLPEKMELELEAFYTRGVFVGKKGSEEEKGAKKKYALLGEDGRIKIRGFELVRRDWSPIAKETQYRVLETILKEGNEKKAVEIVKEAVERLRAGKVKMEELTIITQLNKDPKIGYEVISPELAAAKKQLARGIPLEQGSLISYVITKSGRTISEKAVPVELAKDYDPDYYINNQVLPAVMKILKELGYDEYELKKGGKQHSLNSFFE